MHGSAFLVAFYRRACFEVFVLLSGFCIGSFFFRRGEAERFQFFNALRLEGCESLALCFLTLHANVLFHIYLHRFAEGISAAESDEEARIDLVGEQDEAGVGIFAEEVRRT